MASDVEQVLGPQGRISALLPGYEARPQQQAMAELVADALTQGCHAIVEAPTGVGKSFAYLVPLIQHALAGKGRVVVSTGTIALQEQLINKDLPLLAQLFPGLNAVLVKGRQNYVSLRRLDHAVALAGGQQSFIESREDAAALREISEWAGRTTVGDTTDLGWDPPGSVWRQVVSDRNNCLGRKCPTFGSCHFYNARRAMEKAHLLVVNHHLYFSDLGLREDHAAILPEHQVVVFDEAHGIEDVATDHLGASISEAQIRWHLDGLWSKREFGLLTHETLAFAREAAEHARDAAERFWLGVRALGSEARGDTIAMPTPHAIANPLSPALDALGARLAVGVSRAEDDNLLMELKAQQARCASMAGSLRAIIEHTLEDYVYFATVPRLRGSPTLSASPLSVAALLKERLFAQTRSVILTSATLAADDSDRFLFLRRRVGLEGGLARRLDSPFDYTKQAKLLLNRSALDPNSERFEEAVARWLASYLDDPARGRCGGTFVLFTSYRQLARVHDLVRPELDRARRFVLRHGEGMARAQMLDLFKRTGDAVLFGTSSFWEGVDVPGDALRHVIIVKLPFEVPNHPVVEARHQAIERRGGNAFTERSVPEAILRLKQGFGRLIRTKSDTGTVAILDHRVLTKAYGRYFLRALPPCATEVIEIDAPDQPQGRPDPP